MLQLDLPTASAFYLCKFYARLVINIDTQMNDNYFTVNKIYQKLIANIYRTLIISIVYSFLTCIIVNMSSLVLPYSQCSLLFINIRNAHNDKKTNELIIQPFPSNFFLPFSKIKKSQTF